MPGPYADPTTPPPPPIGSDPDEWFNVDPIAGFWEYLRNRGMAALDPVSKFAQGQYQRTYNQYTSQAARNPGLGFYSYLQQNPQEYDFATQYRGQTPDQRGDDSDRTTAARGRWVTPR